MSGRTSAFCAIRCRWSPAPSTSIGASRASSTSASSKRACLTTGAGSKAGVATRARRGSTRRSRSNTRTEPGASCRHPTVTSSVGCWSPFMSRASIRRPYAPASLRPLLRPDQRRPPERRASFWDPHARSRCRGASSFAGDDARLSPGAPAAQQRDASSSGPAEGGGDRRRDAPGGLERRGSVRLSARRGFWILCSVCNRWAISRPFAWASAFVGVMCEARWLPSILFCQPPPGWGPVTTAGFLGMVISLRRRLPWNARRVIGGYFRLPP